MSDNKISLRELRREKGLTQMELSRELNIDNRVISQYELGYRKPNRKRALILAEYFGVDLEIFFTEIEMLNQPENKIEGQRLNNFRKYKKMSQKVLADSLGISIASLNTYEKGKMKISDSMIKKISDITKTPFKLLKAKIRQ